MRTFTLSTSLSDIILRIYSPSERLETSILISSLLRLIFSIFNSFPLILRKQQKIGLA